MSRIQFTPNGYGPAWTAKYATTGAELRRLNEAIHSASYRWRQQVYEFLETQIREAITTRLGSVPPLEKLVGRMQRYIAHDRNQEVIALDHQPLLHVEWWPCPSSTEHASSILKITPMQPDSPLPFPIADL